jgi:uncharacterized membrane protein
MFLDIFALIVMSVILAVVIWLVVVLGPLPGKIARDRDHPQADAIFVLGWIGIITLGVAWLIALVWAYTKPFADAALRARISELEDELRRIRDAQAKLGEAS